MKTNETTPDRIISPDQPHDGRDWDCQCARCGSSLYVEECDNCEDGYSHHDCGEDCCCCLHPENNVPCDICRGRSAWSVCCSSPEHCQANPLPGRENVKRGEIEWYVVDEKEMR